jgi:sialate O-acetylesterase
LVTVIVVGWLLLAAGSSLDRQGKQSCLAAELRLADIFTDQMVLQRDKPLRVWGEAEPGDEITIDFAGQRQTSVVAADGRWMVTLAPVACNRQGQPLVASSQRARQRFRLEDVLVGDVWLAGGQSNMGSTMREYLESVASEVPQANYPQLRIYTVPKRKLPREAAAKAVWETVTPDSVLGISATAYFFGRDLHRHLDIPIGLVVCAWGGTLAENWISRESLLSLEQTRPIVERYEATVAGYGGDADYQAQLAEHRAALEEWRHRKKRHPQSGPSPKEPMGPEHFQRPAGLYQTMFQTIPPFVFTGIIFYQGESNVAAGRSFQYRYLLPLLVKQWRRDLKEELPFLTVQLPVIKGQDEDEWAEMRESQQVACQQLPGCELAVVLEYGEYNRLHPHGKAGVGARLALLARGAVYGEPIVCRGPVYRRSRVEGRRVIIELDQVGSGLVARGQLRDFTLCDASGVFHPATATIVGETVEVFSEEIAQPLAARYGWKNFFEPSLFNREGLPASPFRSDHFPLKTEGQP